jgi:hypothetical protein
MSFAAAPAPEARRSVEHAVVAVAAVRLGDTVLVGHTRT